MTTIYASMVSAAVIWCVPALIAIVTCWIFGLTGAKSLYVSVPLVAVSLIGSCIYIGSIYGRALRRRR